MPWNLAALTAVFGGLLALERNAFLQAQFSRPLVAATATGLLLEDLTSGVFVGLVFELFFLGSASLGGAHPEHELLPSVSGAAFASSLAHASGTDGTPALWTIAILVCAPLGHVGLRVEWALDRRAVRYPNRLLENFDPQQLRRAARLNLKAMWPHFVVFGLVAGAMVLLGHLSGRFVAHVPLSGLRGLAWAYPAMASVAAAVAVHGSHARAAAPLAAFAAAAVTIIAALHSVAGASP